MALELLQRATEICPAAEIAALHVQSLLRLRRWPEARDELQSNLLRFSVAEDDLLALAAAAVLACPANEDTGWFAFDRQLELIGQVASDRPLTQLQVRLGDQLAFTLPIRGAAQMGRNWAFRQSIPAAARRLAARAASLSVSHGKTPLLGSGLGVPHEFALDARADGRGQEVHGWARIGWSPGEPVRLRIEDEAGARCTVWTESVALPGHRWPFRVDLRSARLRGQLLRISARLPDGRWQPLPDAPLMLATPASAMRRKHQSLRRGTQRARAPGTAVVIFANGAPGAAMPCLESVLGTVGADVPIIIAGGDAIDAVAAERLQQLKARGLIAWSKDVPRALSLHPEHDLVLLHPAARLFGNWCERLRHAAYAGASTGVATAFSNDATAGAPHALGHPQNPSDAESLQGILESLHAGISVSVPLVGETCVYLRRDCLRDVGPLELDLFGDAGGALTDLCLHAQARGWSVRLAADVYVYRAAEPVAASAARIHRRERLLRLRHPNHARLIASENAPDPLHRLRRSFDEHRIASFGARFVLLITLALPGGVDRAVAERCRQLRARGLYPLVLRPAAANDTGRCELWTDAVETTDLDYRTPAELEALDCLLRRLKLESIEVHHFLHLDPRVIEIVRALPVPYDVHVHDYLWICPRVTLIDGSGRYCGEPAAAVCERCIRDHGSELDPRISVKALRRRSAEWLGQARRVVAPSADTAARIGRHFSGVDVEVRPHTLPTVPDSQPPRARAGDRLKVALIGAVGVHKGYEVLLACARDALARSLPLEYVVIGHTQEDAPLQQTGRVYVTGRYTDGEAAALIARESPDLAFFPAVWPETWCYALDHALTAGLRVVAFDLGALAERLRGIESAALLPMDFAPPLINDYLLKFAAGAAVPHRPLANGDSRRPIEKAMSKKKIKAPPGAIDGLGATVQVLPLPPGLFLFSVKTGPAAAAAGTSPLALPAVHVGLGPGVRTEQVEFIASPATHGAWLFAAGDLLVAKVNGSGATLIMTSVRAGTGEVLTIKIERLDSRTELPIRTPAAGAALPTTALPAKSPAKAPAKPSVVDPALVPIQIGTHIRTRGDLQFADTAWAGRVAPGLWIESFSVRPLQTLSGKDIEYKGLTGSGFETPWISGEQMCGTRGMAVPLVGFAVRLKPGAQATLYDCEYSGYFQSGLTIGPLRNGAPCRSTVASDPLEGMQLRIIRRGRVPQVGATSPSMGIASLAGRPASVKRSPAKTASGRKGRSRQRLSSRRR